MLLSGKLEKERERREKSCIELCVILLDNRIRKNKVDTTWLWGVDITSIKKL
jgi:hypothetical protein